MQSPCDSMAFRVVVDMPAGGVAGVVVIVSIGVAVGVTVGILMLVLVLIYQRRYSPLCIHRVSHIGVNAAGVAGVLTPPNI